ncbi:FDLD family class I lanthipeptide [Crossiella sp. SN42]|uniref:FDLD family class I lanthipeptide n=1 Tax=Crossiella sp. SN42 TaxID=2944808 RepID=UPI00207C8AE3|nr:FDLD family class I lanthipeptide [Crossiella sp. SN42]MCO1575631.1 FDLD family class I lanthipeptide [Crossiella sp. SN42]
MDAFDLDARVTTPAAGGGHAEPLSISSLVTRFLCTKTPICSKSTCTCTLVGLCTAGCRQQ